AGRARFHRARLVYREGAAVKFLAVPHVDRSLRFFVSRHLHESETLGAASHLIHDDLGAHNGTALGESLLQRIRRRVIRQVSNVQLLSHLLSCVVLLVSRPLLADLFRSSRELTISVLYRYPAKLQSIFLKIIHSPFSLPEPVFSTPFTKSFTFWTVGNCRAVWVTWIKSRGSSQTPPRGGGVPVREIVATPSLTIAAASFRFPFAT